MNDKQKLRPMLRALKEGYVDIDYAIDFILQVYSSSNRLNNSFTWGVIVGMGIAGLIYEYLIK